VNRFFSKLKIFGVLCCFPPTTALYVWLEVASLRCSNSRRLVLVFGNTQFADRNIILFSPVVYFISTISLVSYGFYSYVYNNTNTNNNNKTLQFQETEM